MDFKPPLEFKSQIANHFKNKLNEAYILEKTGSDLLPTSCFHPQFLYHQNKSYITHFKTYNENNKTKLSIKQWTFDPI